MFFLLLPGPLSFLLADSFLAGSATWSDGSRASWALVLRLLERPEKHRHRKAGEQINERSQQRHRRNSITQYGRKRNDEISSHENTEQDHSNSGQDCRIFEAHAGSMNRTKAISKQGSHPFLERGGVHTRH